MVRNKRFTVLLVLCLLAQTFDASAIEIKGSISCGYWFSGRSKPDLRVLNTTWLVGYLSANGWKSNDIFLNQTEVQSIELWMDEYCRKHSESYISSGAHDLAKELQQQK